MGFPQLGLGHWGWTGGHSRLKEPNELKQRLEGTWLNLKNRNSLIWLKNWVWENTAWNGNVHNLDCLTKEVGLIYYR